MKRTVTLTACVMAAALLSSCNAGAAPPENTTAAPQSTSAPPSPSESSSSSTVQPDAAPPRNPQDPNPPQPGGNDTVLINGKEYTCGQIMWSENDICSEGHQIAFNKWKDNIHWFVNSPNLSEFDDSGSRPVVYQEMVAFGLTACRIAMRDRTLKQFIEFIAPGGYENLTDQQLTLIWDEAGSVLCPDQREKMQRLK